MNQPDRPKAAAEPQDALSALVRLEPAIEPANLDTAGKPARAASAAGAFPALLSSDALDASVEARWRKQQELDAAKEKPDPWPIVETRFPRIAATIRDQWGKRALDDYFAKLVVDDRGTRQGFPMEVLSAIMEIARLHGEQHRFNRPICPWEVNVRESKWWNRR